MSSSSSSNLVPNLDIYPLSYGTFNFLNLNLHVNNYYNCEVHNLEFKEGLWMKIQFMSDIILLYKFVFLKILFFSAIL
jgi:hypothetical protein